VLLFADTISKNLFILHRKAATETLPLFLLAAIQFFPHPDKKRPAGLRGVELHYPNPISF
jgi:hypothetical protein